MSETNIRFKVTFFVNCHGSLKGFCKIEVVYYNNPLKIEFNNEIRNRKKAPTSDNKQKKEKIKLDAPDAQCQEPSVDWLSIF